MYLKSSKILKISLVLFLSGCESVNDMRKKIYSALDVGRGVPLSDFRAENGAYFPDFLIDFFPRAEGFSLEKTKP